MQAIPIDRSSARLRTSSAWLQTSSARLRTSSAWSIIQQAIQGVPQKRNCVGRCASRRSQRTDQDPVRPNRLQALLVPTQTIWTEVTNSLYDSLESTRKRSKPPRQSLRGLQKLQKDPARHTSRI